MNVLLLVGSLRRNSTNRLLAEAAVRTLPPGTQATISDLPAALPFYDEDLDVPGAAPAAAEEFRAQVAAADALIVVTPEYNGTMSAVIKNALDWASRPRGEAQIAGKPVLVLAASGAPRDAVWAREAAVRTLTVAGAAPMATTLGIAGSYAAFGPDGALLDPQLQEALQTLTGELAGLVLSSAA